MRGERGDGQRARGGAGPPGRQTGSFLPRNATTGLSVLAAFGPDGARAWSAAGGPGTSGRPDRFHAVGPARRLGWTSGNGPGSGDGGRPRMLCAGHIGRRRPSPRASERPGWRPRATAHAHRAVGAPGWPTSRMRRGQEARDEGTAAGLRPSELGLWQPSRLARHSPRLVYPPGHQRVPGHRTPAAAQPGLSRGTSSTLRRTAFRKGSRGSFATGTAGDSRGPGGRAQFKHSDRHDPHGDADTTVPIPARAGVPTAIQGAQLNPVRDSLHPRRPPGRSSPPLAA